MNPSSLHPALQTWRYYCFLAGAGLLMLLSFVVYWFVLAPLKSKILAKERSIEQLKQFALCGPAIQTRHESVEQSHSAIQTAHAAQLKRLPPAAHEAEFLAWTSQHARELGLELRDFRPAGSIKYGEYDGMTIRVNGVGSYATLCRYLHALSNGPRVTRVVSIEILPLNAERDEFQITLQFIVFSQVPKSPATNPGDKNHV